jgi:hypothetical protein
MPAFRIGSDDKHFVALVFPKSEKKMLSRISLIYCSIDQTDFKVVFEKKGKIL